MRYFLGFVKYAVVVPILFVMMSGTAFAAAGCMGYFLLLCFSEGTQNLFWLAFLILVMIIILSIVLVIVKIHTTPKRRKQPMASSRNRQVIGRKPPRPSGAVKVQKTSNQNIRRSPKQLRNSQAS